MVFIVLTIFPEMVEASFSCGMVRKAADEGLAEAVALDIRDYASGRHRVTDDKLYGGGCGMVMKPEPLAGAIKAAKKRCPGARVVYMSPQGRPFNQTVARELAGAEGLIFICGRYEGIDERICDEYIDDEISIGDYVLTGGELPALVVADAVVRLVPGVLGGADSADKETFSDDLVEHAQYTRPADYDGIPVPEVLLSGNHAGIEKWRHETSLVRTLVKRPDLLEKRGLSKDERAVLEKWWDDVKKRFPED